MEPGDQRASSGPQRYAAYAINADLMMAQSERLIEAANEAPWALLFSPKAWAADHPNLSLEEHRLTADELRKYAEQISDLRAKVRN